MTDNLSSIEKLQEYNRLRRESGIKNVIKNPIQKLAIKPESLRLSVNAKCFDCIGQDADPDWRGSIRDCACTECPLYPVRPYQPKKQE